jgi:hypothetical protein
LTRVLIMLLNYSTFWHHFCWHYELCDNVMCSGSLLLAQCGDSSIPREQQSQCNYIVPHNSELWKYGWGNEEWNAVLHATSPLSTCLRSYGVQQHYLSSCSPHQFGNSSTTGAFLHALHLQRLRPNQPCV